MFEAIKQVDSSPVTILVNCAGIWPLEDVPIAETSIEVFERILSVNLKVSLNHYRRSTVLCFQYLISVLFGHVFIFDVR